MKAQRASPGPAAVSGLPGMSRPERAVDEWRVTRVVIGPPPEPVEIRHERAARRVVVTWEDLHESVFPIDYLRSCCPCAMCQGHAPQVKYLDLQGQQLVHVEGVGNYAVSLTWQDGHNTETHSSRLLRALCPCATCGGDKR